MQELEGHAFFKVCPSGPKEWAYSMVELTTVFDFETSIVLCYNNEVSSVQSFDYLARDVLSSSSI